MNNNNLNLADRCIAIDAKGFAEPGLAVGICPGRKPHLFDVRYDTERYPRINAMPSDVLYNNLRNLVNYTVLLKGHRLEPEVMNFTAAQLQELLLAENKWGTQHLTWYEVNKAVSDAALEGEMVAVNTVSLYRAICDYITNEGSKISAEAEKFRGLRRRELERKEQAAQEGEL